MSSLRRILVALALGAVLTSTSAAVPPAAVAASPQPAQVAAPQGPSCLLGKTLEPVTAGRVPVLFVHGINVPNPQAFWTRPVAGRGESVVDLVEQEGAKAYIYDYSPVALNWVDDPLIGPQLARTIDCLYEESGNKVFLVGHSMGGLAIKFALRETDTEGTTTFTKVRFAVTIGTPFRGSLALSVGQAILAGTDALSVLSGNWQVVVALEMLLADCALRRKEQLKAGIEEAECPELLPPLRSPVGLHLLYSPMIDKLIARPWPSQVPRKALGGEIEAKSLVPPVNIKIPGFELTIGSKTLKGDDFATTIGSETVGMGDVVVSLDSSLGGKVEAGSVSAPVRCTLKTWDAILQSPCFHNELVTNPAIAGAVVSAVRGTVPAQPGPPGGPPPGGSVCSPAAIQEAVSPQFPTYVVDVYQCNGEWASIGDASGEGTDTEMLLRHTTRGWTRVTGFPTELCPRDIEAMGAPAWVQEKFAYRAQDPACASPGLYVRTGYERGALYVYPDLPDSIGIDNHEAISNLKWEDVEDGRASLTGTLHQIICVPDCAQGRYVQFPVKILASEPTTCAVKVYRDYSDKHQTVRARVYNNLVVQALSGKPRADLVGSQVLGRPCRTQPEDSVENSVDWSTAGVTVDGLGPVRRGKTEAEIEEATGDAVVPDEQVETSRCSSASLRGGPRGLVLIFDRTTGRLVNLVVDESASANIATASGVHRGSTAADVYRTYSGQVEEQGGQDLVFVPSSAEYAGRTIHFWMRNGKVIAYEAGYTRFRAERCWH